MESCIKHPHESGVSLCRRCGGSWCADCLVYAFGPKKLPYCLSCAMVAGGVRSAATRPAISRKELKALQKQWKSNTKAVAKPARGAAPAPEEAPTAAMEEVAPPAAPSSDTFDWSSAWWEEDRQPTLAD